MNHFIFDTDTANKLMACALGHLDPDLVIVNTDLVNVYTCELQKNVSISISGKHIVHIGNADDFTAGPFTRVLQGEGKTAVPGFIEGHTHLGWLVTPPAFIQEAAKQGTTTIITETMELYPVGGLEAVLDFMESLEKGPIKCLATAPAMGCADPNHPGISMEDLNILLSRPDILGTGELYWQNLLQAPAKHLPGLVTARNLGKNLEGHSAGASGRKLSAYLSQGISSCHEPITAEQVKERLRCGIHVMIREGEIRSDLQNIATITKEKLDFRYLCLVSDGTSPDELKNNGHMNHLVQKAIDVGFHPMDAIRMATLNVASHFNIDAHVGGIAPGRLADIILLDDTAVIRPDTVISNGRLIYQDGIPLWQTRRHRFPSRALGSINLPHLLTPDDFRIAPIDTPHATHVRAIEMVTDLVTREKRIALVDHGNIKIPSTDAEYQVAFTIDRRDGHGQQFNALVCGFGLKRGAFACSGAWDSASIVGTGVSNTDMALAVNRIADLGGGAVVCCNDEILAEMPLPLYGLFSDQPIDHIIEELHRVNTAANELGCPFVNPLLSLRTLTCAAIPYFRITTAGLVDLKSGRLRPMVICDESDST